VSLQEVPRSHWELFDERRGFPCAISGQEWATEYKLSSACIESGNSAVRDYDKRALESDDLQLRRPHTRRRRFGVDLARFFLGRPPFLPFSLAALAFASEVEAPPFAPPFVPQFRNISSTAFGSKSLIDLLDFFFVTSAILAR
jgi:hypothetical protein